MQHPISGNEGVFMRYAVLVIVVCLGLAARIGRAQEATAEDKAFFAANIGKLIQLEPTPISGDALEKVFHARFFTVKVNAGGAEGVKTLVAARAGDDLKDVTLPDRAANMAALQALVKSEFKLKTDADGKAFEAALDLLYPPDSRYDEKRKAIRHAGTEWTFVRGAFITGFKGLVVATDADGKITSVRYSQEIKE
jgi:hypothetical protein